MPKIYEPQIPPVLPEEEELLTTPAPAKPQCTQAKFVVYIAQKIVKDINKIFGVKNLPFCHDNPFASGQLKGSGARTSGTAALLAAAIMLLSFA